MFIIIVRRMYDLRRDIDIRVNLSLIARKSYCEKHILRAISVAWSTHIRNQVLRDLYSNVVQYTFSNLIPGLLQRQGNKLKKCYATIDKSHSKVSTNTNTTHFTLTFHSECHVTLQIPHAFVMLTQ
jgi:hypothetical protein